MTEKHFSIDGIPALLCGDNSESVFLCVHGQGGDKECAREFYSTVNTPGFQTLGIDLPCHGERRGEGDVFYPWNAVPEIKKVYDCLSSRYSNISLRADSIGAWFSLLALPAGSCEKCILVSPLIDMCLLINSMMSSADLTEDELRKRSVIPLADGTVLSYKYLIYARENRITHLPGVTHMLYGDGESITPTETAVSFAEKYGCSLTVAQGCGHWFHTQHELKVLKDWTLGVLNDTRSD